MNASLDKTRQVVTCGAAVMLDGNVLEHGVVFVSPEHPPFKLTFNAGKNDKGEPKIDYHFDVIHPATPDVERFDIQVKAPENTSLILPDSPKVLMP